MAGTWTGSNFKQPRARKVATATRRQVRRRKEDTAKTKVRKRDGRCRFPLCGCQRFHLRLEVSHRRHKGMGGNPKGDRSTTAGMIYLCSARHKENLISVDRGTLRWIPLTRNGADGPVRWLVDLTALQDNVGGGWYEVAREVGIGLYEPFSPEQTTILRALREMQQ